LEKEGTQTQCSVSLVLWESMPLEIILFALLIRKTALLDITLIDPSINASHANQFIMHMSQWIKPNVLPQALFVVMALTQIISPGNAHCALNTIFLPQTS